MIECDANAVPMLWYLCRRRRYNGIPWLIVKNQYFRLSPDVDHILGLCDGRRSIIEIASQLPSVMSVEERVASVVLSIEYFRRCGAIDVRTGHS